MHLFKSNVILRDPIEIYTDAVRNRINEMLFLPPYNIPNSRKNVLLKCLQNNIIHWGIECDGGEFYAFIEWNNHSRFDIPVKDTERFGGRLTLGDIRFMMVTIAEGLRVNMADFSENWSDNTIITSLVSNNPDENGKLTAIFYFK